MIVKFPPTRAGEPDCRFCGICGRLNQPLDAKGDAFGPCLDGQDNAVECADLQRAVVQAHNVGEALGRGLHPEWAALIARLGLPEALVTGWVAKDKRVAAIRERLQRGVYGMPDGEGFVPALQEWMRGADSDERLLALIEILKPQLDPLDAGTRQLNMLEICDWFERLAARANDILSDPGDWEMEDA